MEVLKGTNELQYPSVRAILHVVQLHRSILQVYLHSSLSLRRHPDNPFIYEYLCVGDWLRPLLLLTQGGGEVLEIHELWKIKKLLGSCRIGGTVRSRYQM